MEQTVFLTCGKWNIPCKITQPDDHPVSQVVLGVHGLCGSARDQIQTGIAEEMTLFSAVTVRFDFPGHGQNPMTDGEFTVKNCMSVLLETASWAKENYPQVEDLCVFATGFGAYITLLCVDDLLALPGKLKLVVQTPSVLMHETLLAMLNRSRETFRLMDGFTFPVERPITVNYDFYEELRQNIALNSYSIPMLILHGQEDDYIRLSDIRQLRRINEDAKLVFIPGASHRFQEEGAWDMVLDLTRDWFAFEQVLVCDWE